MRGTDHPVMREMGRKRHREFPPGTWVRRTDSIYHRGVVLATQEKEDGIFHLVRVEWGDTWQVFRYRDDHLCKFFPWPALEARYLEWILRGEG